MTEEWIAAPRRRDGEAFEELVRQFSPMVYKLSFSMLGNEHDAADAVQETFIKVFKSLSHLRDATSLKSWLCHIAANTCRDMLRAKSRYKAISPDDETVFLEILDESPTPEEATVQKEKREAVRAAVASLPTEYKLVITLCDLNGLSYGEAAKALGCPLGTLKSRLSRARSLLLKILSKNQELFSPPHRPIDNEEA